MRLISKKNSIYFIGVAGFIHYLYGFLGYFSFDPPSEYYFDGAFILYLAVTSLVFNKKILSLFIATGLASVLLLIYNSTTSYPASVLAIHFVAFFFFLFIFQFEKISLFQKLELASQRAKESKQLVEKTYLTNVQAAHDLGSPLTAIKAVADKIKYEDPKLHYLLEDSLKRITTVSEGLLNVHKQVKKEVEADFFDLENNISQIVNEKRHEYKHIKHFFIYYRLTAPMLHEIRISKTDFYRIFSNIVNNSIDAMERNTEKRIKIVIDPRDDENVDILISDNGKGIPEDQQESIFMENISFKKNGTGLGLSYSRKTAEKWGGRLTLKKSGPDGTTLQLTLPYTSSD